jgi:AcrR family transcriptional regulator
MKSKVSPAIPPLTSTRARLLQSAAILFRTRGYSGATTRNLAASLGIQSASLYHHIGKKEDLLFEMSVTALENITSRVNAAVLAAEPPDRLRALIRAHLAAALADQDAHAVMLSELRALSGERRGKVLGLREAYRNLVERTLADGQACHTIRDDTSAKNLALGLLNLLNWTIFWYRPEGELSPESLADLMSLIFIEGVGVRDAAATDGKAPVSLLWEEEVGPGSGLP